MISFEFLWLISRLSVAQRDKAQAHQLELERQRAEEERRRESEKRVSQQVRQKLPPC